MRLYLYLTTLALILLAGVSVQCLAKIAQAGNGLSVLGCFIGYGADKPIAIFALLAALAMPGIGYSTRTAEPILAIGGVASGLVILDGLRNLWITRSIETVTGQIDPIIAAPTYAGDLMLLGTGLLLAASTFLGCFVASVKKDSLR